MTHFEQLFIALNAGDPQGRHCIQAHSPGLGTAVGQEILDQCLAWASGHPGGLDHAVVLSFPLKAVMPAIKGPLFAIIRVTPTFPVAFHALVMSKRDFRAFDYNPFAVLAGDIFLDSLTSGQRLNRGSLEPPRSTSLFGPAPNPGDVGLVDEGLQLFLLKGKLILNLDSPGDEADRVMGLIIQFLPLNLKEKLRFASFSGSGDPGYTLAACFASGNSFASWQRLFMTMENQGIPEPVRKYVAQVRNALVAGDPQGVNTGAVVPVGRNMVEPRPGPSLTTVPVGLGATSIPGSPQNRQAVPAKAVPGPSIGLARAVPTSVGVGRPGGLGPDPAPARGRGGRSRLIRQALPTRRPPVTRRSRQLGVFTLIVALLVVGWVYLDRSGKGRQWGIFDLMGAENRQADAKQAPSLLEVVDVGAHYNRQLSRIQRSRLIPGKGDDRQLRRAQAQLLADAAGPLLQQVDLFVELARGGIQQGHRPDREKDRLRALALQGRVLEAELGRLELAYFSFGQGVLWSDLDRLSDTEVAARRDSLARVRAADLGDATRQVGSESCWDELASACRNTEGMADMLDLFQATQWSAGWERDLKAAAEKVSPTASPMSRAYRNNAFTLLRLKKAERSEVEQQAAFADDWRSDSWLSPGVRDVLTDLRHKSALFGTELRNKSGNDRVPALLQGVLSLYARLEKPEALVQGLVAGPDVWRELQANAGRRFDPAVYQNHLDRARYEALARLVGLAVSEDEIPAYLKEGWDWTVLPGFLALEGQNENAVDWSPLAVAGGQTFLGRWAQCRVQRVHSRLGEMQETVDRAWLASRPLEQQLRQRRADGQDWTSVWVDLNDEILKVLGHAPTVFSGDPVRSGYRSHALALKQALGEARPLAVQSMVVRLDQEVLPEAGGVVVEFQVVGSPRIHRSTPVKMGPAAPAGSGWVGTGDWDLILPVSPRDAFQVRVWADGQKAPVLTVDYPSLEERVGPGAFGRPRRGEGGSLVLRTGDSWWRSLQLPAPVEEPF